MLHAECFLKEGGFITIIGEGLKVPHLLHKTTGRGVRIALILWIGLVLIVIAFSFQVGGTQYVTFSYDNGKQGTAFYYRSPNPVSRPAPIVIYVHGYNNLKTFEFRLIEFTRRGWDVLAIDLPKHGSNQNEFTTGCWKVIFGAIDYVQTRPNWWNTSAIGVVGHSFGGLVSAMGILFDNRIAAGVLWAPLLDLGNLHHRVDSLFPMGHPFYRFTLTDSPLTYIQSGKTLNNTLILHGTNDLIIPFNETLNVYQTLLTVDPLNLTCHSFELISGGNHLLYEESVIRETISWLATHIDPARKNALIQDVESAFFLYPLFLALEVLAIFGIFPAIFVIFVDRLGKIIERRRWETSLESGLENDEFPPATSAITRDWKWHFSFYIIALLTIMFVGVNLFDFLPFHFQLGIMGAFMSGTTLFYEYLRHRWYLWKSHISREEEKAEEIADELIDPWPRRLQGYARQIGLGFAIGASFLLSIYALTFYFGFLFSIPISIPYLFWSLLMAFFFSLGIEWLFRRRIQVLIEEVRPYAKIRTCRILNFFLIIVLPFVVGLGFFLFCGTYTPIIYALFYAVTALCLIINYYLFEYTHSLVSTITLSTFVMGWVLAGCLTPAYF